MIETIQMGIPVARIELVNQLEMQAMIAYSKLDYEPAPYLFLEFHGSETSVAEQAELFGEIAAANGGGDSSGRPMPKSGKSSGRRGTIPILPA